MGTPADDRVERDALAGADVIGSERGELLGPMEDGVGAGGNVSCSRPTAERVIREEEGTEDTDETVDVACEEVPD